MKKINILYLTTSLLFLFLSGCFSPEENNHKTSPIKIAISKAVPIETYQNYVKWIKYGDSTVVYYDMYHLEYDSAMALLKTCNGLLLTGGTDIFPARYGKERDTARCWTPDFKRDTMEVNLLNTALKNGIPIMGVCRGLQMINVEMGGKLYIDLPTDLDTLVKHQNSGTYKAMHEVVVMKNSLLHEISGIELGKTNSNHHQGIEVLAPGLDAIAHTPDGLTESIELDEQYTQFLLAVQWHPERMEYSNPLSGKLAKRFMQEARDHKNKQSDE